VRFGLFGIGSGACADPGVARRVARAAEYAGLESLWTGEHVVLPDPQRPPSPVEPLYPMLHPSTALAYLAGVTNLIRLGTGIVLIAQRNPLVLAKEMASLDVVAGGRVLLGIGAGYLQPEFAALGVPFHERGARTDEYIDVLRELWTSDQPRFSGRFVAFSGIQARPRPLQAGGPPLHVGGTSDAALRRAVTRCQGWYGFALDVDATRDCIDGLRAQAARHARPEWLRPLEITVTPRAAPDLALVEAHAALGVHRLVFRMPQEERGILRLIEVLSELDARMT
jgi:probable F420-dependent oxidoreductase